MRVVHCKKESYDVLIDRSSIWGNPWSSKENTKALFKTTSAQESVDNYKAWLKGEKFQEVLPQRRKEILEGLSMLNGKTLGCWCHPKVCHGDVLVELCELTEF